MLSVKDVVIADYSAFAALWELLFLRRGFITTLPRMTFSRAERQKSSGLRPLIVLLDDILAE